MVVYVHGLWQRGAESLCLRRRLARDLGAETRVFSYPSVRADATANGRALGEFLSTIRADSLHLVGHSLGGVVILKFFEGAAPTGLPPGRVLLLGSPVRGCRTALNLARLPLGGKIMGRSVREEMLGSRDRLWNGSRDLGIIAGDSGRGLGRLIGALRGPSDGTILVEETRLDAARDHIVLRVGHTGMLFSAAVARQAGAFLKAGRFQR